VLFAQSRDRVNPHEKRFEKAVQQSAHCFASYLDVGTLLAVRYEGTRMSEDRPAHWGWDFLRPVNLVGLALAVLGIAFGVYAYYRTSSRPQISWSSLTQIVFDQHNATSAVTVLDAEGNKISANMYASQITVWNSGNERFDDVDDSTLIRKPLTFRLTGGVGHIVSAAITNTLNDTAGGWSIEADRFTAVMAWRHFDPGAAAKILILYTGDGSGDVRPEISVAGLSVLREAKSFATEPQTGHERLLTVYLLRGSVILPLLGVVYFSFRIVTITRSLRALESVRALGSGSEIERFRLRLFLRGSIMGIFASLFTVGLMLIPVYLTLSSIPVFPGD
jgi:hypothetical protein